MMLECWQEQPSARPPFTDLRNQVDRLLEKNSSAEYLCLDLDNNYYFADSDSDDCDSVFMFGHGSPGADSDVTNSTSLPVGDSFVLSASNEENQKPPGGRSRMHSAEENLRISTCSTEHLLPAGQMSTNSRTSETHF